ncbi:MAG: dCTP deaminase [Bacteroidetes bacterium]|nr:dCTP deaminase [Bacteroidota bacterium]
MYLTKKEISKLIKSGQLVIRPLLEDSQLGEMSLDLRLGTDFLLSFLGREVNIDATGRDRTISSFYDESRRLVGESFVFHPHQTVLCSTLEYIKLPKNIFIALSTRSSFSRLGFSLSTVIQPGYCGCLSIELINTGNTPVKLLVGSRIIQARFFKMDKSSNYLNTNRKYICQVRPQISKSDGDSDIDILKSMID